MAALPQLGAAPDTQWQELARCSEEDGSVFFPPAHVELKPERLAREELAKSICAECPVTRQCLDWALATREPHGVWGGLSETERRQLPAGGRA